MRLHTDHEAAAEELETVDAHIKSTNASPLPSYTGHNSPLEPAHLPAHMEFSIIIAGSNMIHCIGFSKLSSHKKGEKYTRKKLFQKYFIICFFNKMYQFM